jgi:hypothetical protein
MFPAVAYALEIKTFTDSMPHIIVPHVTTPQVNTHIITPQVKLHVITPEGSTGSKITNTNSDNITIKDSHTKLQNQTNGLQQQSTVGGASGGSSGSGGKSYLRFQFGTVVVSRISWEQPGGGAPYGAPFGFNKIDLTGKASVVSLINPGADSPKIPDQVSPAVLLGLEHSDPDRPFVIGSAYNGGGNGTGAAPKKVGGNILLGDRLKGK